MARLIKTWKELDGLESENYVIKLNESECSGWIKPKVETDQTRNNYFEHHEYLSMHTFCRHQHQLSTEILQKFGFDVEIDNWDK